MYIEHGYVSKDNQFPFTMEGKKQPLTDGTGIKNIVSIHIGEHLSTASRFGSTWKHIQVTI